MKIHYVSGSRADFGLMENCLLAINSHDAFELELILTGQHMSPHYGDTASEIRASELFIACEIPVRLSGVSGAEMAEAMSKEISELTKFWEVHPPDIVLLLGDRGEMVAAALAAVHLGVFIAHIHGGERSGTLDESFRHAISKLSHFHFPATDEAANRLKKMGEDENKIEVIGAPGLVGITEDFFSDAKSIARQFHLNIDKQLALVAFHPVVQEAGEAGVQIKVIIETLLSEQYAIIVFNPNSDAGGVAIEQYLHSIRSNSNVALVSHLKRQEYLKIMGSSNLMIGNSSSGIIESASFNIPFVNIGSRQDGRLSSNNTVDCREFIPAVVRAAINKAKRLCPPFMNSYGYGDADKRLIKSLASLKLDQSYLKKINTY